MQIYEIFLDATSIKIFDDYIESNDSKNLEVVKNNIDKIIFNFLKKTISKE